MNKMTFRLFLTTLLLSGFLLSACNKDDDVLEDMEDDIEVDNPTLDDNGIDTLVTSSGVQFVRTPEEYFQNLSDWSYAYQYVEIDGLRQAYAQAGPADGEVVLLLHGQPSWSYLYRTMIPVLADAGYRVIAMDHLGMGRSDKPIEISEYSYLGHGDRLEQFILQLGLSDINLFVQDWGSLIGLRVAGLNPDWFATISVGNGNLPVVPP
ncbi:MAG: alpha/beta fold hydrolase, partial [Bacteroidota bacterium]